MEIRPLFYWPTTLMMVDDSLSFLESVCFYLGAAQLTLSYQNPKTALEILKNASYLMNGPSCLVKSLSTDELDIDGAVKKLDYQSLSALIFKRDRFAEISTLLVDYSMPHINGIEFCRKIADLPIKKIMLTGEAGHDLAVAAFNEGIIDAFLTKDIDRINHELGKIVLKMRLKYFSDVSLSLMGASLGECKEAPEYVQVFDRFIHENQIVEYYRIDRLGSYLGLDKYAHPYWLVIKSENSFLEELNIAKLSGEKSSAINKLKEKTHLLFLFSELEKRQPVSDWQRFLFPVNQSFQHEGKFYYTTIIKRQSFSLDNKNILSFDQYRSQSLAQGVV